MEERKQAKERTTEEAARVPWWSSQRDRKVEFEFHLTHKGGLDEHEVDGLVDDVLDVFRRHKSSPLNPSWVKYTSGDA